MIEIPDNDGKSSDEIWSDFRKRIALGEVGSQLEFELQYACRKPGQVVRNVAHQMNTYEGVKNLLSILVPKWRIEVSSERLSPVDGKTLYCSAILYEPSMVEVPHHGEGRTEALALLDALCQFKLAS